MKEETMFLLTLRDEDGDYEIPISDKDLYEIYISINKYFTNKGHFPKEKYLN